LSTQHGTSAAAAAMVVLIGENRTALKKRWAATRAGNPGKRSAERMYGWLERANGGL
jgi:hypothetical protein